jgi:glycosyltransferase involved in cell wall biosynthesis
MKLIPVCQQPGGSDDVRDVPPSDHPLVTVLVACYNQASYVEECLESIKSQTYQNLELIIIDDCSGDNSATVINDWLTREQVSATLIVHDVNRGICRTFNEALALANGKYVSILAADDVYLADKIETQVAMFEELPETVGVIFSDAWRIDEGGSLLPDKFISLHRKFESVPEGRIFGDLLEGNFIPAPSALVRRSCYQTIGVYDESLVYEDYDMWLRISREYDFAFSPMISAKYRVSQDSVTRTLLQAGCGGVQSDFRIFEKCLKAKRPTAAEREIIKRRLKGLAFEIYARNCPRRRLCLLKLLLYVPGKYSLLMMLLTFMGIPARYLIRLLERRRPGVRVPVADEG